MRSINYPTIRFRMMCRMGKRIAYFVYGFSELGHLAFFQCAQAIGGGQAICFFWALAILAPPLPAPLMLAPPASVRGTPPSRHPAPLLNPKAKARNPDSFFC